MNALQEEPLAGARPRRRVLAAFLLGMVPVGIAATAGVAASAYAPVESPSAPVALALRSADAPATMDVAPAVVAPGSLADVDVAAATQKISVTFPPPPEPEPVRTVAPAASASTATAPSSSGSKAAPKAAAPKAAAPKAATKPATKTPAAYCASPSSPYSAGGSVKGLLTAANKERARIGVKPMTWSSNLANAATTWSKKMASSGGHNALAHNPNRPGAENVAVSYSSAGTSIGAGVNKAHSGWMYSGGHCNNIMNPAYSTMGAGAAQTADGKTVYTTANFK